jgi:leader peptidase (prepilin peptidase)/N-methyltransferase
VLTFFLAAFIGLGHAAWKIVKTVQKLWNRRKIHSADRELPLGPYLSMAALVLLLSWRWVWPNRAEPYFRTLRVLFWYLLGYDVRF